MPTNSLGLNHGRTVCGTLLFVLSLACFFQHFSCKAQQRTLLQIIEEVGSFGDSPDGIIKDVSDGGYRPFLALKDPATAAAVDVQRLYEQGASASAIAYLLFGAAEPLSQAEGSSTALLPYLSPTIIRLYSSQPERCASTIVHRMYNLSYALYGSDTLKVCHYEVYKSLGAAFSWLRDHAALRVQELPDQPLAAAAWPDLELQPAPLLAAAVADALADGGQLGDTAAALAASCGMGAPDFAQLVPIISKLLADLHADLPMLQQVAADLHDSHWAPDGSPGLPSDGRSVLELSGGAALALGLDGPVGHRTRPVQPSPHRQLLRHRAALPQTDDLDSMMSEQRHNHLADSPGFGFSRRLQATTRFVPPNFFYDMPPSPFVPAAPATTPKLFIPLVFHIMLYTDSNGTLAPAKAAQAPSFVARLVRVANYMALPANVQFFVREVRNNATGFPYLLLSSRSAWLTCPKGGSTGRACLANATFLNGAVVDYPRSVNVFVVSDSTGGVGVPLGYAWVPGSDTAPQSGHVFMTWDGISVDGSNSLSVYNDGPNTLLHELFHHLGLYHSFNPAGGTNGCSNDDYVIDTPTTWGPASSSSYAATATAYCMELFWGTYGGDWDAAYTRWSTTLGIPDTDMNAWADTCPARAGYDELGNYMTYNTPVCFAALGHFTPGQVQRAHVVASELNPVLYAWGQYYAANSPPPPPQASPPPEVYTNICKATRNNCGCKSSWILNGATYSFCDRTGTSNLLSCEVLDPVGCADCATTNSTAKCVLPCTGTTRTCQRALAPGTSNPPPPPPLPPSPPPMPPPPPPVSVPAVCMKSQSGCECRRTWMYGSTFASYCASPDGATPLWCEVTPSCPTYDVRDPTESCAANLTLSFCGGGRARFSTSTVYPPAPPPAPSPPPRPPSPPPPPRPPSPQPPPLPPSPPAPSTGAVAAVSATIAVNASCSSLSPDARVAVPDLVTELASVASVPAGYISISSVACSASDPGLLIANFSVYFPPDTTAAQVANVSMLLASTYAMKAAVSSSFQTRWGGVSQAASTNTTILQRLQLVSDGPYNLQRLSGYSTGLVEVVLPDGGSGLVCASGGFGASEATMVCRELGFASGSPASPPTAVNNAAYQSSLFLDGLSCDLTSQTQLEQCASRGWIQSGSQCNISSAAAVACSGGLAAVLDAGLTLNVSDCSAASLATGLLTAELFQELAARLYSVSASRLVLSARPSCGGLTPGLQLRVNYSLLFPAGSKAASVDAAQEQTNLQTLRTSLSAQLQARWGQVAAVDVATVYVVDRSALCTSSADGNTRVCAAGPTGLDRRLGNTSLTIKQAIGIGVGLLAALLLLLLLGCLLYRTRRAARIKPSEPAPTAVRVAWGEGGGGEGGAAGGGAPQPAAAASGGRDPPAAPPTRVRTRMPPAPLASPGRSPAAVPVAEIEPAPRRTEAADDPGVPLDLAAALPPPPPRFLDPLARPASGRPLSGARRPLSARPSAGLDGPRVSSEAAAGPPPPQPQQQQQRPSAPLFGVVEVEEAAATAAAPSAAAVRPLSAPRPLSGRRPLSAFVAAGPPPPSPPRAGAGVARVQGAGQGTQPSVANGIDNGVDSSGASDKDEEMVTAFADGRVAFAGPSGVLDVDSTEGEPPPAHSVLRATTVDTVMEWAGPAAPARPSLPPLFVEEAGPSSVRVGAVLRDADSPGPGPGMGRAVD